MPFELIEESSTPQQSSGIGQTIGRNLVRGAARAAEAVAGLPGDILSSGLGLGNLGVSALTGSPSEAVSKLQKGVSNTITSGALRKNITERLLPEEYSQPSGKIESFLDDIVSDVTSLLTGKVPLGQSLLRSFAGNISQEAVKALGGGDTAQVAAKLGAMTLAGVPGTRKSIEKFANTAYGNVEKGIKGKKVSADSLFKVAEKIHDSAGSSPHSDLIKKQAKQVLDSIEKVGGKRIISADKAWNIGKDNNAWLRNKNIPEGAAPYLGELVEASKNATRDAAKSAGVITDFNAAEEIWKGLRNRSAIGSFLDKHVKIDSIKNPLTKALLFHQGLSILGPKGVALGVGAAYVSREASKLYDLLSQSKAAQRIYGDVIVNALKGNSAALIKNVARLDKEISRAEGHNKGRYELL